MAYEDDIDKVAWIEFEHGEAMLKRAAEVESQRFGFALVLCGKCPAGRRARIARVAEQHGMAATQNDSNTMVCLSDDLKDPQKMANFAAALGARVELLDGRVANGPNMTVHIGAAPSGGLRRIPNADMPRKARRPRTAAPGGAGRRARRPDADDSGAPELSRAAARLIAVAEQRVLKRADLEGEAETALKAWPQGAPPISRSEAAEAIRTDALRRILGTVTPKGGLRQALDLAEAARRALAAKANGGALRPSAALLAFLRHIGGGFERGSMRGHADLGLALPEVRDLLAEFQLLDLSDVAEGGRPKEMFDALAPRPRDGLSAVFVPGPPDGGRTESLRGELGRVYCLEAVAQLDSAVAEGSRNRSSVTALFVGERRPRPLDPVPEAAGRVFRVAKISKLPDLEAEMARSRRKIAEFNRDERARAGAAPTGRESPKPGSARRRRRGFGAGEVAAAVAGLLKQARQRILGQDDVAQAAEAALKARPKGSARASHSEIVEAIRSEALRQITAIGLENGAIRPSFNRALRLAGALGPALARRAVDGTLRPSAALLALLRRAARRFDCGDMRGHADLEIALPAIRDAEAAFQLLDLGDVPSERRAELAFNALSRRPKDGLSAVLVPEGAGDGSADLLRAEIGCVYGLEAVARLAPVVAGGLEDADAATVVFVGARRPRPIDALPEAARRTFAVAEIFDLPELESEMLRSRGTISAFNRDEDALAAQLRGESPADARRQLKYKALSQIGESFSMIPRALEGAAGRAFKRAAASFRKRGGIDEAVAEALGCSHEELKAMLIPEQVDAVGMRMNAAERGRGFLLADQTGIGKGRSLAAMIRAHLRGRPKGKVLYFTESASVNLPDVCRDLVAVGAWDRQRTAFLVTGTKFFLAETPEEQPLGPPSALRQREIFESGAWPRGVRLIVTTYSKFSGPEGAPQSIWLSCAPDADTMIVMDEAHNALNPKSNTGRNLRAALGAVPASAAVFASGTPARDPRGLNLYRPLLPDAPEEALCEILDGIESGGTVAQEAFASMLAEDGVMLRRDHDLGNITFKVDLPDDARMARYQQIMDRLSPIVEGLIGVSVRIGEFVGRRQALEFRRMIDEGVDESVARQRTNELQQYSMSVGGPLANFARVCMNALKIDQTVAAATREAALDRKPLITFHSTNAALLQEVLRLEGRQAAPKGGLPVKLSLKDQVRRIHEGIYEVTLDGDRVDARSILREIAALSQKIDRLADALPDDLPASPLDSLKEKLEAGGYRVGEISGRLLCYRGGRIERRGRAERDRRAVIDAFNAGDLDILIYNSAGATGASYHASPEFRDQRGRTMVELETPVDIIKYVQSQGRGNRYGQVETPKVVSVMTGLTPEMRILQQRNSKLRSLGASVDGNRAHPLLLDDVPDFLNRVGDEAAQNVLLSMPLLARRLGFTEIAEREERVAAGEGDSTKSAAESLANRVLARSIMLPAAEQDDLVRRIRMEFDVLIEELESRNANPLKPRELAGRIDVKATTLFSGQEAEKGDLDASSFLAPLYVSTGMHHMSDRAVSAQQLAGMVERCAVINGSDGLAPRGEKLRHGLPVLLRSSLPEGHDMDSALRNPGSVPGRFAFQHARLIAFAGLLDRLRPGVAMRFPDESDEEMRRMRIVVDLAAPRDPAHDSLPSAYKVKLISPGMAREETVAVSRLLKVPEEDLQFHSGLSEGMNQGFLKEFDRVSRLSRQVPVQILGGNILRAIAVARENNLGTVSLYRDMNENVSRGIVVRQSRIDMANLPVSLPSGRVAAAFLREALARRAAGEQVGGVVIWGGAEAGGSLGDREKADVTIRIGQRYATVDTVPLRVRTFGFYRDRPGLFEALHDREMPSEEEVGQRRQRRGGRYLSVSPDDADSAADVDLLCRILGLLDGVPLRVDGHHRALVNAVMAQLGSSPGAG